MKLRVITAAILALVLAVGLLAGCGSQPAAPAPQPAQPAQQPAAQPAPAPKDPIKLGGIVDLTGATADVGTPYAEGERDFFEWLNARGGIDGAPVNFISFDYEYQVPRAVEVYDRLVQQDKVAAILGWGTGDTNAMAEKIGEDRIPYMSASYDENLVRDVNKNPYNFFIAASYSDQGRVAIQWIKDNWKDTARGPRVALLYNSSPFGKAPMEDIKAYAHAVGVEIVDEQIIELNAVDATSQLLNMQRAQPDYGIIQQTTNATVVILKDAKKLGIQTQFIGLNWAFDEGVLKQGGDAAEGYMGISPFVFPESGSSVPGLQQMEEFLKSKGKTMADVNQKYVAGWATAMAMTEGIRLAPSIDGPGIKAGLEQLSNWAPAGLGAPITFTPQSHHGVKEAMVYQIQNGKFVPLTGWYGYDE